MAFIFISIIIQTPTRVRMAGVGWMLYSNCWPETMFLRQRKMNSKNFFDYIFIF